MKLFPSGHATHPQWPMAAGLVLAQLRAQMAQPDYASQPTLGLLYITDHYASQAEQILAHLREALPEVTDWAGTVGLGVVANNVEYIDEPAMSVLLCALPAGQFRVFSGVAPLGHGNEGDGPAAAGFRANTALVHADGESPELPELVAEVAGRTGTGYLFGGLSSARQGALQFAAGEGQGAAGGVLRGGLSGVAFGPQVRVLSRVTQGCQPLGVEQQITAADGNLILTLDGEPALDRLLETLQISLEEPEQAIAAVRATLAGLSSPGEGEDTHRTRSLGNDTRVRHIIGLDPNRRGVAVADEVQPGMHLTWCRRNAQAARADLMRICAEIREELEPEEQPLDVARAMAAGEADAAPHLARRMAGAVYVSCVGRGGAHFGGPHAELQIVRHALGDVPLTGFFAGGEIARHHLYGYTGVLTVFVVDERGD
ncbi:FIST C-terminal domain-containing protein [Xenophilus arseniciresistens]|uniref:FIST C-terminal domain-containing protein n=1 Tax=Xenophilus arseniciresistens TaxID=1283306 RepID=A0AAE3NCY4_9BURK|nr:FIST N-terminal domain-containing protein [Xenophilus arseniciresistens]MDA7418933.1 FIST C-terminal domain-containing protein [Xenophilus arseniciresistens]